LASNPLNYTSEYSRCIAAVIANRFVAHYFRSVVFQSIQSGMNFVLDAHHHLWKYSPNEYMWIDGAKAILQRDFLPIDLERELVDSGMSGAIAVQARQSIAETEWLLDLADANTIMKGVVGWAPLIGPDLRGHLDRWSSRKKLRALRHVLQDEPDDRYAIRADFNAGISLLNEYDLRYDILIFQHQLPAAIELVDRHPNQIFIIDHIAKPRIAAGEIEPWRTLMIDMARRPNLYCKVSGMATEADWSSWTEDALRPYFDVTLNAFGPQRLMFGSDWPVCLLATSYARWVDQVRRWTTPLSESEQGRVWGGTAVEAYGL
jgi:L-fuconolactonase